MPHRVEIPVHWCEHVQAVKFGDSPVLNSLNIPEVLCETFFAVLHLTFRNNFRN